MKQDPAWYERWFGESYLELYQHRNCAQAKNEISWIVEHLQLSAKDKILDIACGGGRHLKQLIEQNLNAIGIDFSTTLLLEGKQKGLEQLVRADMRALPFKNKEFNVLLNLFTSFGYFECDQIHQNLLLEWNRVLAPAGKLLLDYLNPEYIKATLVETESFATKSYDVTVKRKIEENYVIKEIHLAERASKIVGQFSEKVRLYSKLELTKMLNIANFELISIHGDFNNTLWSSDSKRAIYLAQKQ
jgi:ubiquinone/menaquinone biosynthesis C-methylase UbiE